jgi:GNAT superfamily N-acetyltransferase
MSGGGGASERVTTIYLEMVAPPTGSAPVAPRSDLRIMRAEGISVGYYRFLYDTVGEPWRWIDRRRMDQAALASILADPRVAVHVLYAGGVPAGYIELDGRADGEIEVAYFGIAPGFIGQGLGPYLLGWGVATAWATAPRRLWVHTCSLDHPAALRTYLDIGFREVRRETTGVPGAP